MIRANLAAAAFVIALLLVAVLAVIDNSRGHDLASAPRIGLESVGSTSDTVHVERGMFLDPADATTTTARKVKVKARAATPPELAVVTAADERRGIPCGGADIPPCWVLDRESMMTDDPLRVWNDQVNADGGAIGCYYEPGYAGDNPCGSTASGPWQVLRSTWNWFGGYLNAADAPLNVQLDKVRQLWNGGRGCTHWKAC